MLSLLQKLFGSRNERVIKGLQKQVSQINQLEAEYEALSADELKAKTTEFRQRLEQGEKLDKLLPEAFAVVREASKRTLGLRHFDVQLLGGMVLHNGNIAEMRTGEGKTLVATLATYLNALPAKGVHIITVNDYLAKRDAEWMAPIYEYLGLTVGVNLSAMSKEEKQAAYAADITYGTNNEFGFDYLRDNMAFALEDKVQRNLSYAIVDEVDSILIDEARTPLIISGPAEDSSELYIKINKIIPKLNRQQGEVKEGEEQEGDYTVDEKMRQAYLTEQGHSRVEELLEQAGLLEQGGSLYDAGNILLMHHVSAALRAHTLFQRDVDYLVKDNKIVIIDEHTGRTMEGRRWSDGLHQAVEAKEGVAIQNENQTLASITFQNYFRIYNKLAGMTGTADTEAYEFHQIYGLEVIVMPTNRPMVRKDNADQIYLSAEEKFAAIIKDIQACRERGQPVLVGTISVETSEYLSKLLDKQQIPHSVLNAKFHEKEAQIVTEAGRPGAVTIATNMAGRGTDIVLGGSLEQEIKALDNPSETQLAELKADWQNRHEQVLAAGGLHIIGTERHESRRIDNQLRGRSGRQGDPGSSRFYLSFQDNLMRIFASDRLANTIKRLGLEKDEAIEHKMVSRAIENAQRKVESRNFDIRKQLLDYDNVANEQRQVVYRQRSELMSEDDLSNVVEAMRQEVIDNLLDSYIPPESMEEQWNLESLQQQLAKDFTLELPIVDWAEQETELDEDKLKQRIRDKFDEHYQTKTKDIEEKVLRQFEKAVVLQTLDLYWKEHLAEMDHLRQGIHLRGYAQKDPKQEYKREAFELFANVLDQYKFQVVKVLSSFQLRSQQDVEAIEARRRQSADSNMNYQHSNMNALSGSQQVTTEKNAKVETFVRDKPKVGRNDPCPCGSGKKYKQCHGKLA